MEDGFLNSKKIALNYLRRLAADFPERMRLVKEHEELSKRLVFLEKRYNIDKISDPDQAKEVMEDIEKIQERIKEILEKLSF